MERLAELLANPPLPELTGAREEVATAESIRQRILSEAREWAPKFDKLARQSGLRAELRHECDNVIPCVKKLLIQADASWWTLWKGWSFYSVLKHETFAERILGKLERES